MKLETLENTNAGKGYAIRLDTAEVVSRCPMTGLPDYYRVIITYEPDATLVELKSLKLYFVEFLDRRTIHEDLLNTVVDDFVEAVSPKWVHVLVTANVRGDDARKGMTLPRYVSPRYCFRRASRRSQGACEHRREVEGACGRAYSRSSRSTKRAVDQRAPASANGRRWGPAGGPIPGLRS